MTAAREGTDGLAPRKKLIEVSLPLEAINRESAREKSLRQGHPSTIHLWWARRPLAAARAVVFAQLVDDPSSRPDRFPTEEDQDRERAHLFEILERLCVWENANDPTLLSEAQSEIARSAVSGVPSILDPFSGGGAIPLEAQRLGLTAYASDLNPVAVLINKALIEIPPKWAGHPPVFPEAAQEALGQWTGTSGLAEDVRRYGRLIHERLVEQVGHLYPSPQADGGQATEAIAWLWGRTVKCPNPACGIDMPLIRSRWLAKGSRQSLYLVPVVGDRRVRFKISGEKSQRPSRGSDGTVDRTGATCLRCGTASPLSHIRGEGKAGRLGQQLLAICVSGPRGREFLPADDEQIRAADVPWPPGLPDTDLPSAALGFRIQAYGMKRHIDIYSARQASTLVALKELVKGIRDRVLGDARACGMPEGDPLDVGGAGAAAYSDAMALYMAMAMDRVVMSGNTLTRWNPVGSKAQHMFGRQTVSMLWDFAETAPLGSATGSWPAAVELVAEGLAGTGLGRSGVVQRADARDRSYQGLVVATDPPYYDNVGYADLSDVFYVWLRECLRDVFPDLFQTTLTPKADELIADPDRHGSASAAEEFFEDGFRRVFAKMRQSAQAEYPMTLFYAFKQSESGKEGEFSTGWQKLLEGLLSAGWAVTATWPIRTEMRTRMRGMNSSALASSIVLACRPRLATAEAISRRGFLTALQQELPRALKELEQGSIAPVDLAQAAIGPGMAVYSRYSKVVEADGSDMTVRTALALINQVLDEVLSAQEGDFDADTRFCVTWFGEFGWSDAPYGRADDLARSRNTAVEGLVQGGVFWARAGRARLLAPEELGDDWDPEQDDRVSVWEVTARLAHALATDGVETAAGLMAAAGRRVDLDAVKELAYLLFALSEKKNRTETALLFNQLASSWPDLTAAARRVSGRAVQGTLTLDEGE